MTNSFPECDQFPGRLRDCCNGTALDARKTDIWRTRRGLPTLNGTPVVSDYGKGKLYTKSEKKVQPKGVGTCLHELFVSIGINPPCVTCGSFAALMDCWGIEGCRTEHREEIIQHLDEEAKKASWLDWAKVIKAGYFSSNQLLNEAIRRAEVKRDKLGESLP